MSTKRSRQFSTYFLLRIATDPFAKITYSIAVIHEFLYFIFCTFYAGVLYMCQCNTSF